MYLYGLVNLSSLCNCQVLKIAIVAEKYAHDYTWYVDTILKLIRVAGDYVSEDVWYRIIQIVINRQEVQGYAAKTCFEVRGRRVGGFTMYYVHVRQPILTNQS